MRPPLRFVSLFLFYASVTFAQTTFFIPTDIPGLELWLKAYQIEGLSDGDPVVTWEDQSGLGNDATQGTAGNRPTYQTSELNGKPVIRFDGGNDLLEADGIAATFSGSDKPFTVYIVSDLTASANFKYLWSFGSSSSDNPWHALQSRTDNGFSVIRNDDAAASTTLAPSSSNYDEVVHLHTFVFSGTVGTAYVDGTQSFTGTQDLGTMTIDQFTIGALRRSTDCCWAPLDVAEVLVYSTAHSSSDQADVEAYLNNRYHIFSGFTTPRSLPDTTSTISSVGLKYSHVLPANGATAVPEIDLWLGGYPNPTLPATDTLDDLHTWNNAMPVLMYMTAYGEPHEPDNSRHPWGIFNTVFKNTFWEDLNVDEIAFFHTANPAFLTFVVDDGTIDVYWNTDNRDIIDNYTLDGYNVWRATVSGGPYTKRNGSLITVGTETFADTGTNGTTYYYLVRSEFSSVEREYSEEASVIPTATPPSIQIYAPKFSISFDAGESEDGFHPNANKTVDHTFTVQTTGSPTNVDIYLHAENFATAPTQLAMTDAGGGDWSKTQSIVISSGYVGSFAFYFDADSILTPTTHRYTTSINNRIRNALFGFYHTDPTEAEYREHVTRTACAYVDSDYDGVFIDLLGNNSEIIRTSQIPPLEHVQDATQFLIDFIQGKKDLIDQIKSGVGTHLVLANGDSLATPDADYFAQVDGMLIEQFVLHASGAKRSEADWKAQIDQMILAQETNSKVTITDTLSILEADIEDRIYALASYLVGKGAKAHVLLITLAEIGIVSEYFIYEALGAALTTEASAAGYFDATSLLYRRNFAGGIVLVNAKSTQSNVLDLGSTFQQVTPTGGTLDSAADATSTAQSKRFVQLDGNTSMILLNIKSAFARGFRGRGGRGGRGGRLR